MTLAGRIKIGMAAKGIKNPTELAKRLKMRRQTVHKWLSGDVEKLDAASLFLLADELELSARWLATRDGQPQPKRTISPDDQRVIDLYNGLKPEARAAWVQTGDTMLKLTGETSKNQPFKTK